MACTPATSCVCTGGINTYDATSFNTVETGGDDEVSVYGKLVIEYFPYDLDLIILPLDE